MAAGRTRNIILKITGDERDAKRAAQSVREELRRLSREEVKARIDLDTRILERKVEKVKGDLDVLSKREPSPEVDLKTQKATRKLDRLNLQLDKLKLKRVQVDVDVKRGGLERAVSLLGGLDRGGDKFFKGVGDFFRSIPVLGQMLGVVIDGFVELGNGISKLVTSGVTALSSLVPALASLAGPLGSLVGGVVNVTLSFGAMLLLGAALIVVLNAVLGAIVALGGALVALAASAAAAVGGLLALGAAFGGAMIPALIVGVGLMTRFLAVLKARQAQQQALAQSTQAAKTAEEAHTRAVQQRKQAEEQLAQATVAGRQAAAQAIRDEQNAELGLLNAKNGVADSRLQLALAKRDLKDFLKQAGAKVPNLNGLIQRSTDVSTDPAQLRSLAGKAAQGSKGKIDPLDLRQKLQAIRDAQLGVKNATNEVTNAEDRLAQSRTKEADFAKRGLKAYGPYRTALAAVARANQAIAKASEQKTAAENKYQQALAKLSPTEKTSLANLDKFLAGFQKFAKAVSDPVFKALNDVWDELSKSGIDFQGALVKIGDAFGDVVRSIGGFLTEPATRSAFKVMADGAADLVRELGARAFRSFLTIMRDVATTALPAVQSAARDVANWLGRIAGQPKRIHSAVETLIGQFKTWARFAGAVAKLVIALFSAAAPAGKSLATSMTTIVNHWTKWIKDNPEKVRRFFRDAVTQTKDIAKWLGRAVSWLKSDLPAAAAKAKHALETVGKVLGPLIKLVDEFVNKTQGGIIGKFLLPLAPRGSSGGVKGAPAPPPGSHYDLGTGKLVPDEKRGPKRIVRTASFEGMREGFAKSLALPVLTKLSTAGGATPAAAAAGGNTYHIHVTPLARDADPDPQNTAALIQQALEQRGGIK